MKKVLYVISGDHDTAGYEALAEQWDRRRHRLEFVLLSAVPDLRIQRAIRARGFSCTTLPDPGGWRSIGVFRRLVRQLRMKRPDVVHVDLPEAPMLGLLAARLAGVEQLVISRPSTGRSIRGAMYRGLLNVFASRITLIQDHPSPSDHHAVHDAG